MTWFETPANQTESAKASLGLAIAADFDFTSGHFRASTWSGDLTIGGNTYGGVGQFGAISMLKESALLVAEKKSYRLQLVDTSLGVIPESDMNTCGGRPVVEYLCFINVDTGALVGTEITFEGRISSARRRKGKQPSVEISAESRLIDLDKADNWRWTHEHQQQFYAGDLGFNQVQYLELREIFWGGYPVRPGVIPGPGGRPPGGPRQPL